jgi:hypothetical protein
MIAWVPCFRGPFLNRDGRKAAAKACLPRVADMLSRRRLLRFPAATEAAKAWHPIYSADFGSEKDFPPQSA